MSVAPNDTRADFLTSTGCAGDAAITGEGAVRSKGSGWLWVCTVGASGSTK
jgi:hypothetical protein